MRPALRGERRAISPWRFASRARSLADQWLKGKPQSLGRLQARAMIAQVSSGVMRRGAPERGASLKRAWAFIPEPALASHRPRHWLTPLRQTPRSSAVSVMLMPSANRKIIRARKAKPCAVEGERSRPSSSLRSSDDKTIAGAGTPMAIPQNESVATENQAHIELKTLISRVNNSAKVN